MATPLVLGDLERINQLYAAGLRDPFLDTALHKIIAHQIARDEADLTRVNAELARFEALYGQASEDFWRQFHAGQAPDSADAMEWNVLLKMRQRIVSRLRILRGNGTYERVATTGPTPLPG
jgi:hypothetical protein